MNIAASSSLCPPPSPTSPLPFRPSFPRFLSLSPSSASMPRPRPQHPHVRAHTRTRVSTRGNSGNSHVSVLAEEGPTDVDGWRLARVPSVCTQKWRQCAHQWPQCAQKWQHRH
eukprot:2976517-Rhodomonas_salina.1